jgi:uncharacterized protein involved in exopolysaccharide biosynthesis
MSAVADANESTFSVRETIETLWRGRIFIAAVTTAFIIAAGAGGLLADKYYKATTVLAVASTEGNALGGLGSMLSQFGGLASLAGISGVGADRRTEAVAVLQSRALTVRFIEENNLLPVLYAGVWDPEGKKWNVESPQQEPTLWKANEYFKKIRTVVEDRKTGLITLTIKWGDPKVAAQWANGLVELTNRHLREKAIEESDRNIAYLTEQVSKSDLVGVRTALYGLVENEIKQSMLARGREDYALKVLDPAVAPEFPASPRLLVWLIGGLLGGLFVSMASILLRAAWLEGR